MIKVTLAVTKSSLIFHRELEFYSSPLASGRKGKLLTDQSCKMMYGAY